MVKYNLWIDDIRPAPEGWLHAHSVNAAKEMIIANYPNIEAISLDHDAGDYARFGGDYINLLKWLEEEWHENPEAEIPITFYLHTMNPVGRENMLAIIERNGWKYKLYG